MNPPERPAAMRATDLTEKTSKVDDERVIAVEPLPPPEQLIRFFPVAGGPIEGFVASSRDQVRRIVHGIDDRLLVVIGPCSRSRPSSMRSGCTSNARCTTMRW
jgi:3-deoxy-7-phosphoheptulonate synthase